MTMFGNWRSEAINLGTALREELSRRAALAREPQPHGVRGPSPRLLWRELGSLAKVRRAASPIAAALRPQSVMLIPGFGSHPARMRPMHRALESAGHDVTDWGLGFNFGPTPQNFAFLLARIDRLYRARGAPVALVGWSLGGLFAREAAKMRPHAVSRVITLGTPFSGDRRANNAWRAYQFVTGHSVDEPPVPHDFATKPPVPTVALWSPRDGVIAPRAACGRKGERDRAVPVRCSHLGFAADPQVVAEVLRQLDRED